jgi:hypothetical protein
MVIFSANALYAKPECDSKYEGAPCGYHLPLFNTGVCHDKICVPQLIKIGNKIFNFSGQDPKDQTWDANLLKYCLTDLPGNCALGVLSLEISFKDNAQNISCQPLIEKQTEDCDNQFDDDCDGYIDEQEDCGQQPYIVPVTIDNQTIAVNVTFPDCQENLMNGWQLINGEIFFLCNPEEITAWSLPTWLMTFVGGQENILTQINCLLPPNTELQKCKKIVSFGSTSLKNNLTYSTCQCVK